MYTVTRTNGSSRVRIEPAPFIVDLVNENILDVAVARYSYLVPNGSSMSLDQWRNAIQDTPPPDMVTTTQISELWKIVALLVKLSDEARERSERRAYRLKEHAEALLTELKEIIEWHRIEKCSLRKQELDHIQRLIDKVEKD